MLFNVAIDWVMRKTTEDQPRGIRWNLFNNIEDLDFADDIALLCHTHTHMQEKTNRLSKFGQHVGLKISQKKTEIMTLNIKSPTTITIEDSNLPQTQEFTYLGSIIRHDGGAEKDIKNRLGKARNAFNMLNNVWKSQQYSIKTKLKLYRSCVVATLLYGSECWRMTEKDLDRLSTFHTKSLRRIKRLFWPKRISNEELLSSLNQDNMNTIITQRRWRWIGHVLRKDVGAIPRVAIQWRPEGKRKRGRPKNTWRRTVETEAAAMGHSWGTLRVMAQDRDRWRSFVAALIASRQEG